MKPERKNLAASVHDRLLKRSRERGEDFSFVLHRYAAERYLYRLGLSTYREQLVLKGAMLFAVWGGSAYRPTRDLDFTGYGDSEADAVLTCFREICDLDVLDDALVFGLREGDILLGMSGSIGETGSFGNFAVVREENIPCQLNQRVGRFRLSLQIEPHFLIHFIQSPSFSNPLILTATSTAQFNISPGAVGNLVTPLPPLTRAARHCRFSRP